MKRGHTLFIFLLFLAGAALADTSTLPVDSNGNTGIGTTMPAATLQVGFGSPMLGVDLASNSMFVIGYLEVDGKIYGDGSMLTNVPGGISGLNGITGAGYVVKAAGASSLADSVIYQSSGNIGIGSTAAQVPFEVDGSVYISTGNVGIGTALASRELHVQDDIRLSTTTSEAVGVIYKGSTPFIHDYAVPGALGGNLFMGVNAGNFTMTDAAIYNIGIGKDTLSSLTAGYDNIAIGYNALNKVETGHGNTAMGVHALASVVDGIYNTAMGVYALENNTADYNTAIGGYAMRNNTTGTKNTAAGAYALQNNQTGNQNVVVGEEAGGAAGISATNISDSVIFGYKAGNTLQTGADKNILIGYQAGDHVTIGTSNIVIGYDIDPQVYTGSNQLTVGNLIFGTGLDGTSTNYSSGNIGIGSHAPTGKLQVTGGDMKIGTGSFDTPSAGDDLYVTGTVEIDGGLYGGSLAIGTTPPAQQLDIVGSFRMPLTTTATTGIFYKEGIPFIHDWPGTTGGNAFVGVKAGNLPRLVSIGNLSYMAVMGYEAHGGPNLTMPISRNTAFGYRALYGLTTSSYLSAFGAKAMQTNTTGGSNIAFGAQAAYSNVGRGSITAIGYQALFVGANSNTAIGAQALYNATGQNNTAVGSQALYYNTTGTENSVIGYQAGKGVSGGASTANVGNVIIGTNAGLSIGSTAVTSNNILIGYQAGDGLTGGSANIVIGHDIDPPSLTGSNQLTIGNIIFGTGVTGTGVTLSTNGNIGIGTASPASKFEVKGSEGLGIVTKTSEDSDYTAGASDRVIFVDATGGDVTIKLPVVATAVRRIYDIKKIDISANSMIITPDGAEKIDNVAGSLITTTPNQSYTLICDSSVYSDSWWVF